MLTDFDFSILEDPEFREDSVREEILTPLIRELGYSSSGKNRIIRSRRLQHPFVSIGSGRVRVTIIPDYLLLVNSKPFIIIEAKSPTEDITKSKHCEQAYSYAIHPEVRAKYYALCNGLTFSLFYISRFEPLLSFRIQELNDHIATLKKILHPDILAHHELLHYHPDCGLYFRKLGLKPGFLLLLHRIHTNAILKVNSNCYSIPTVVSLCDSEFLASLDFDETKLIQLLDILPNSQAEKIQIGLESQPFQVRLDDEELLFGAAVELGDEIYENKEEQYAPFTVKDFMPYLKER